MKLLIAEDDPDMQKILKLYLQREGCQVNIVDNGRAAIDFLSENQVDLVILDWMIPVQDGIQTLKEIRLLNFPVKVLMLTAKGEIENEMIQNLKRLIQESCIASRDFATYSVFKALNDLIYQDFNFYQNLLSHANAHGSLISKIKNALQEEFLESAKDQLAALPEQFPYMIEFVSSGIISMYILWFDSDQKIPLEELAKTAGVLVSNGIDTLVRKVNE